MSSNFEIILHGVPYIVDNTISGKILMVSKSVHTLIHGYDIENEVSDEYIMTEQWLFKTKPVSSHFMEDTDQMKLIVYWKYGNNITFNADIDVGSIANNHKSLFKLQNWYMDGIDTDWNIK